MMHLDYDSGFDWKGRGPHQGQPVHVAGVPLEQARAAVVMLHGRGGSADDILSLAPLLGDTDLVYLAPQAAHHTWYPLSFLAPIASNEPDLSSGMQAIEDVLARIAAVGIPLERTVLVGFSQGACLVTEFVARYARRYGGLASLSGGIIGPDDTPRDYSGSLDGTPVFFGCSDIDPHIPAGRVKLSDEIIRRLGGNVTTRLYPGMGHLINQDELVIVRAMLEPLRTV